MKACAAGDATMGPTIVARLVDSYLAGADREASPALDRLTDREADILRAMSRGLSNGEIARELFLAETTVKTHVARGLATLGGRDRVQAVMLAHRSDWLSSSPHLSRQRCRVPYRRVCEHYIRA